MKIKKIKTIIYGYSEERLIKNILYHSKEPILLKIPQFTDTFSLEYFERFNTIQTTYCTYLNNKLINFRTGNFAEVISQIKNNEPHRIFAEMFSSNITSEIEKHVPLWQIIPFRPRYFNEKIKMTFYFGGANTNTPLHYDREHTCNLHLCLSGKKRLLLFTKEQNKYLYKLPFFGDSLIDFSEPDDLLLKQYPKLAQAEGYEVILERGDMLFLPRNCWHYTEYLEPSSSATYVFYPNKFFQFLGHFTGHFFLGFKEESGFRLYKWPVFQRFDYMYASSDGKLKYLYTLIEKISYLFLLPIVSILHIIAFKIKPRRPF
ncbi:cupin-like domain-containing protein [Legionella londiniensis]|uniref:Eukaryotic small stress protein PASS1 n=1 Tax=Legionella londiniensis TaxID=45068 RepID=A0A0W0VKK3_9GAMM|nr:cupin-like domain-containing protein [Legionella londiniensis]KTD20342.1 eukaryotic small stress protein PASS1 [Legionella londiniensis]STX93945.1 eukaryotic small stress protein [Legionella londiniensis]